MVCQRGRRANHYLLFRSTTTAFFSAHHSPQQYSSLSLLLRRRNIRGLIFGPRGCQMSHAWPLIFLPNVEMQVSSAILLLFVVLKESWKGDILCPRISSLLSGPGHSCWQSYYVHISLVQRLIKSLRRARYPMKLKQISVCVMDA